MSEIQRFLVNISPEYAKYEDGLLKSGFDTILSISKVAQNSRLAAYRLQSRASTKDVPLGADHAAEIWLQAVCESKTCSSCFLYKGVPLHAMCMYQVPTGRRLMK